MIRLLCAFGVLCCLVTAGRCGGQEMELANPFMKLAFKGASVTELRADPEGAKPGGLSFVKDLRPEFWEETEGTRVRVEGNQATISPLMIWPSLPIAVQGRTDTPEKLEPGHTLAQSFRIPADATFASAAIRVPTWNTSTSGATLSLLRDGEVLASRRLEKVPDNSWQSIGLDKPLGEGVYAVQLSDPVGEIGWWSGASDISSLGEALKDGKPVPLDRSLQVEARKRLGEGSLRFTLKGNRLEVEAEIRPNGEMPIRTFPWRWRTTWTRDGYDCGPEAGVIFSRFYTDNQRYLPIQQLKRRSNGGLAFDGCRWIQLVGNRDADLRLEAEKLHLHWEMSASEMSLRFDSPMARSGDLWKTKWSLSVKPRGEAVPEEFPRFSCSDRALEGDLNRFFWERNFSYGAPPNPSAEWFEWMALMRGWVGGPLREAQIRQLLDYPITRDGYVHTYGESLGWPLVQSPKYDTRHFDTNARFVLGCWRYYLWTGDLGFLRKQEDRLRRAMLFQLEDLRGREGLIVTPEVKSGRHKDLTNNYWDILPFGHLDAYANAVFYASLTAMEQMEKALGSPALAEYSALRRTAHRRYDEVFWDEKAGRYIGCVDADGNRHDYGFTFVNLEALGYGLGDSAKARRIYHWMETEPTSSGKADTYSRWLFAPRSSTIHNPIWRENAPESELKNPAEPWWTFWWGGTPFGDQCQDGGAILYVSFYDLMARVRYRGADDAWGRFRAIVERYRLPDRLCGGSPLSRGEISQQEDAGAVGVDYPFPESGLVPCYFLYGVIGIEATPEGLRITPRLPKELSFAEVKYLSWHGHRLRVRVTKTSVEVEGLPGGKARKYAIKPGGSVLVTGE